MPLPRLKVLRETYCSQQAVDTAIGWMEAHRPELIGKLMEEEHWREQAYSERAWDILEYLTEEKVEIPTSLIGCMDLINEFTRRGRKAAGLPEIPPKGKPLASGPDQPLPPLAKLDIKERTRKHITQEVADRVLQLPLSGGPTSGSRSPRNIATKFFSMPPSSSGRLLRQVLDEERPDQNNMWPEMVLYHEALGRIFRMCEVS